MNAIKATNRGRVLSQIGTGLNRYGQPAATTVKTANVPNSTGYRPPKNNIRKK